MSNLFNSKALYGKLQITFWKHISCLCWLDIRQVYTAVYAAHINHFDHSYSPSISTCVSIRQSRKIVLANLTTKIPYIRYSTSAQAASDDRRTHFLLLKACCSTTVNRKLSRSCYRTANIITHRLSRKIHFFQREPLGVHVAHLEDSQRDRHQQQRHKRHRKQ